MRGAFKAAFGHHDFTSHADPGDLKRIYRSAGGNVQRGFLTGLIADPASISLDEQRRRFKVLAEGGG
jgi:hypothetical protein